VHGHLGVLGRRLPHVRAHGRTLLRGRRVQHRTVMRGGSVHRLRNAWAELLSRRASLHRRRDLRSRFLQAVRRRDRHVHARKLVDAALRKLRNPDAKVQRHLRLGRLRKLLGRGSLCGRNDRDAPVWILRHADAHLRCGLRLAALVDLHRLARVYARRGRFHELRHV